MKYLNLNDYDAVLLEQYEASTSADIIELINLTKKYLIDTIDANNKVMNDRTEFIASIIMNATQYRKLSFKQWKALKAFIRDCNREKSEAIITKSF